MHHCYIVKLFFLSLMFARSSAISQGVYKDACYVLQHVVGKIRQYPIAQCHEPEAGTIRLQMSQLPGSKVKLTIRIDKRCYWLRNNCQIFWINFVPHDNLWIEFDGVDRKPRQWKQLDLIYANKTIPFDFDRSETDDTYVTEFTVDQTVTLWDTKHDLVNDEYELEFRYKDNGNNSMITKTDYIKLFGWSVALSDMCENPDYIKPAGAGVILNYLLGSICFVLVVIVVLLFAGSKPWRWMRKKIKPAHPEQSPPALIIPQKMPQQKLTAPSAKKIKGKSVNKKSVMVH